MNRQRCQFFCRHQIVVTLQSRRPRIKRGSTVRFINSFQKHQKRIRVRRQIVVVLYRYDCPCIRSATSTFLDRADGQIPGFGIRQQRMLVASKDSHNPATQLNGQARQLCHIMNLHLAMRYLRMFCIGGEVCVSGQTGHLDLRVSHSTSKFASRLWCHVQQRSMRSLPRQHNPVIPQQ